MASDTRPGVRDRGLSTAASKLMFPPLHQADDPRFHNPILQHPLLDCEQLPIPTLDGEVVQVPEHLLPLSEDLDTDTLPIEQHPSYPFGNPFFIHHAPHTLQPAGSSQPKLDPRVHSKLSMHTPSDAARDDALSCVASGTASAQAAVEAKRRGADADADAAAGPSSYTLQPDGSVVLAPHLQMRAQVMTVPQPPTWPFRHYGPGPSARPYAALFRSGWPGESAPEVSIWADFALETLVPRPRPDSYTLPSSLQHPYAQGERSERRARPSEIPAALGMETAETDHLWLDDPTDISGSLSDHGLDEDAASWTASAIAAMCSTEIAQPDELFSDGLAPKPSRFFSPAPRARQTSSAWMQEGHDFCHTLLSVYARKQRSTQTKRRREHAASPGDVYESRKKHRIDGVPLAMDLGPPTDGDRWVWGVSDALER